MVVVYISTSHAGEVGGTLTSADKEELTQLSKSAYLMSHETSAKTCMHIIYDAKNVFEL